jgi:hypothetical protein
MQEHPDQAKHARFWTKLRSADIWKRESPASNGVEALVWWESRRIQFNLIVGCAGIVTCVVIGTIAAATEIFFNIEFGLPNPPIFAVIGIFLYGIIANVCFTGGWITELFLRRFSPREADRFATTSFFCGVIFSVLLTLAPAVLVGTVGAFRLVHHLTAR